jgi:Fe-Mn family superoxide dismutase
MSTYSLPDLRYDYGALEPHISGKIMELHHDKHHAAYVKGANQALEKLGELREKQDFTRLGALEKSLAFNLSGHVLHSLFWQNLTPKGGGQPDGELGDAIANDFGSFASMRKQLTEASSTIMGSGWGALVWEPLAGKLLTTQIYDHQSNLAQGGVPILVLDAWEHAYYLQYQNKKTDFFEAVWSCWNWEDVAERFAAVRSLDVALVGATT